GSSFSREPAMLLRSIQSMKTVQVIPTREGQGPSGPGVGCGIGNKPTPGTPAPPLRWRGFSWEHQLQESALPPPANSFPPKKCADLERQGVPNNFLYDRRRGVSAGSAREQQPFARVMHSRQRQKLGEAELQGADQTVARWIIRFR